jgi:hypothetical protein
MTRGTEGPFRERHDSKPRGTAPPSRADEARTEGMAMSDKSEKVTWEVCPTCGRTAAVGWMNGSVVEMDCVSGCTLSNAERHSFEESLRALTTP